MDDIASIGQRLRRALSSPGAVAAHVVATALWLVVWQLASWAVGQPLLLPGPVEVLASLVALVPSVGFWGKVGFSATRIVGGLVAAYVVAAVLALCSHAWQPLRVALRPPLVAIKATPVACVVVLLLIWLGAANVSAIAVFLMALPGLYFAFEGGFAGARRELAEMLRVHGVRGLRYVLAFTWPEAQPYVYATSKAVIGMSWKAGVAAELIGTPLGSIGERIYQAKLLLDTADLFAWTIVVIVLASLTECVLLEALRVSGRASFGLALRLGRRAGGPGERAADAGRCEAGFGRRAADGCDADGRSSAVDAAAGARRRKACGSSTTALGGVACGALSVRDVVLPHGAAGGQPVSLEVPAGGRVCVMGRSGLGKTTLLRTIAGLERPRAGEVRRPARLSAEFQEPRLYPTHTPLENVLLVAAPSRSAGEVAALLLEAVPDLDPSLPAGALSGGQARRVELVRALVAPGDLVLLDEPFAGLDPATHEAMAALVLRELRGRALVVATHDEADAKLLHASLVRLPS